MINRSSSLVSREPCFRVCTNLDAYVIVYYVTCTGGHDYSRNLNIKLGGDLEVQA